MRQKTFPVKVVGWFVRFYGTVEETVQKSAVAMPIGTSTYDSTDYNGAFRVIGFQFCTEKRR
jgi:hypothetical protein